AVTARTLRLPGCVAVLTGCPVSRAGACTFRVGAFVATEVVLVTGLLSRRLSLLIVRSAGLVRAAIRSIGLGRAAVVPSDAGRRRVGRGSGDGAGGLRCRAHL